jgi:predicted metal-dependent hydrolase
MTTAKAITHHKFPYSSNLIEYSLIRSNRLKTSEVIVDEKGVVIRVPANKPDLEIHNILRRKGNWIIAKKQEYLKVKKQIKKSSFEIGSTLHYMGKNYLKALIIVTNI